MGSFQKKARAASRRSRSPVADPTATVNRAGGVAFEITNPSEKLLTMVGARLDITEPSFYNADECIATRGSDGVFQKLQERVKLVDGKLQGIADAAGMDDVSRDILATAVDVLNSENPRDALAIANWARNEVNLRLTPAILLVMASMHPKGKRFVRQYGPKIVQRPDDIKNALLFWRYIQGARLAPKSLLVGLAEALSKFGEAALMKYDGSDFPKWKDVLRWLPRHKDYPIKQALREYFVSGIVSEETPGALARKRLSQCRELNDEAKDLIKATHATWENVLSQFGTTPEGKKSCWEYLVEADLVGTMAALRNLRNLIEANVNRETVERISNKLGDPDEVRRSRQMPFRYLAAAEALDGLRERNFHEMLDSMFSAIENAVEVACERVPEFPGITVVFADNSGSMNTPVSWKSKMSCRAAANMLAGIVARRAQRAFVCSFSDDVVNFRVTPRTTALGLAQEMSRDSRPGCTNTHACFRWLIEQKIKAARVILLSDMQAWHESGYNETENVAVLWEKVKKFCGKDASPWLHCVHLNGYGDQLTPPDPRVNLISGFSENILGMMLKTEGLAEAEGGEAAARSLPTIEQIRANW